MKRPQVYAQLSAGRISYKTFLADTELDQLKPVGEGVDLEWAKKIIGLCLMSELEFEEAVNAEKEPDNIYRSLSYLMRGFLNPRTRAIPLLCNGLDRFAFRPSE